MMFSDPGGLFAFSCFSACLPSVLNMFDSCLPPPGLSAKPHPVLLLILYHKVQSSALCIPPTLFPVLMFCHHSCFRAWQQPTLLGKPYGVIPTMGHVELIAHANLRVK